MTRILTLAAVLAMAASTALAAPCRDDHGKFIKCPPPPAAHHDPVCKIGKPCGHSCIARDKVCHRP